MMTVIQNIFNHKMLIVHTSTPTVWEIFFYIERTKIKLHCVDVTSLASTFYNEILNVMARSIKTNYIVQKTCIFDLVL